MSDVRTPHPPITDNFAYKFETPDGVIVFSSDTAYNPKLAEFAKGADVLVHECLYLPAVDRLVFDNIPPGFDLRPMARDASAADRQALLADAKFTSWVESRTPAGRWAKPEELGGAVVFLASDAASYVNGHVLAVDGGLSVSL